MSWRGATGKLTHSRMLEICRRGFTVAARFSRLQHFHRRRQRGAEEVKPTVKSRKSLASA
jgi:hypothetical protein